MTLRILPKEWWEIKPFRTRNQSTLPHLTSVYLSISTWLIPVRNNGSASDQICGVQYACRKLMGGHTNLVHEHKTLIVFQHVPNLHC